MKRLVIVLSILVVILMIGMGFFMYYIFASAKSAFDDKTVQEEDVIGYNTGSPFITTLKDSNKIIKADIVIEVPDKQDEKILSDFNYRVRDCILTILGNINEEDINNKDFKDNLKTEIKNALQDMLKTVSIKGIYFNEFVIQ